MKCPHCQLSNPETRKFCRECGARLLLYCPQCRAENLPGDKFCGECGERLEEKGEPEITVPEAEGERKHVTVLFSDLSGYTAMSEKLDPEDTKDITTRIFKEIATVIDQYEGFVEKYAGDAVMAIFGVPEAHEDDPLRAIRAAIKIHELVETTSPEIEGKIGQSLSMHTGINTGLVVTGEVNLEKGTHGVAGDTINVASRLSSFAKPGEILVGQRTYQQSEGYFNFQEQEPTKVKGKVEPVRMYKVLAAKERPLTIHRVSGLRADLIGRKAEITRLREAIEDLRKGKGTIFSVCGDAGTGKSRLIEEFKATLDREKIQWLEGHAYPYAQNIPYFPMIDLLNQVFRIEEGDSSEDVRQKVASGLEDMVEQKESINPYIGSLYSLHYSEIESVSPEFWKSRLHDAIQAILSAVAQKEPTVFHLEDLHWADPSFIELLRETLLRVRQPAIVLCVYRPGFSLFKSHMVSSTGEIYQEIRLKDLSASKAQDMLESLLKTDTIPSDLKRFVQDKAEGNPFYLEELVNSLIESEILIRDNGRWKITNAIAASDISSTINGLISGRLDRLEGETKRILQEASVIGRAFLYEILKRITELKYEVDRCLRGLEQLDLIRTRSLQPDLEYVFKHALTQEVAYNGLLKKERKEIHERIGNVVEKLFENRLPEFYETLAFHFSRGQSVRKAVDYLIKSAEKSSERYALEESHHFFREAFELIVNGPEYVKEEKSILIDLFIKWSYVFWRRGDFREVIHLLIKYEDLAESLGTQERLGMYYAWLGIALQSREQLKDAYSYLQRSVKIGEEIENHKVIGYACTHLTSTCSDMGLLDEAVVYGRRAQEMARLLSSDSELFRLSLSATGGAYYFRGEGKKTAEIGKMLLENGQRQNDTRSTSEGYMVLGLAFLAAGDIQSAIEHFKKTIQTSVDPFRRYWARFLLGTSYAMGNRLQEAADIAEEVTAFSKEFGSEILGTSAKGFQSLILLAKGNMSHGIKVAEEVMQVYYQNGSRYRIATAHLMQAQVYLRLVQRAGPKSFGFLFRNIRFLLKNVPFARKKAEDNFNKSIEVAKEIGAKGVLGQAYLGLGLLHRTKGRKEKAKESISRAIEIFEEIEADGFIKQSQEALDSLG